MHTSRPLVEHRREKGRKGLRSDSPPELKDVGVASILELSSVSTPHIADTAHRTPLDTYLPSFYSPLPWTFVRGIFGLTSRWDHRSNPHPRRPPHHLPQIPKPEPKPSSSGTIQQHPSEIHLRPLIIQTTSPAFTPLHPTYLTLRSALQWRSTYASGCSSFDQWILQASGTGSAG